MKVICVIPTFNCRNQVTRVLAKLRESHWQDFEQIWVVDNLSQDATHEIAKNHAFGLGLSNLKVFQNSRNINLGGTHKVAFEKARLAGATHVLILHGDDQANAIECANLLNASASRNDSSILGSRFMRGSKLIGYDSARIAGNLLLNFIYSFATGKNLKDLGSGLNLFSLKDVPADDINEFGNTLSFNYELILYFIRNKRKFSYIPISWSESDQASNARNFKIFFAALRILQDWLLDTRRIIDSNSVIDVTWKEI